MGFGLAGKHKYVSVGGASHCMDQLQGRLKMLLVQPSAGLPPNMHLAAAAENSEPHGAPTEGQSTQQCGKKETQWMNAVPQDIASKHLPNFQLKAVQDPSKFCRIPSEPSQSQHLQAPSTPSSFDPPRPDTQPIVRPLQPREMQPSQLVQLTLPYPTSTGRGNVYHISSRYRTAPEPDYTQYYKNQQWTQVQGQPLQVKPQPVSSLSKLLRRMMCCGD